MLHLVTKEHQWNNIIYYLIENGLNINEQDNDGNTPLHFMTSHYIDDKGITKFLKLNPKLDIRNNLGETPLLL